MNLENINNKLEGILTEGRLKHSKNVADCAKKLAAIYGYNEEKAYIAGMAHDCAKCLNEKQVEDYVEKYEIYLDALEEKNPALSHSIIGACIAKYELGIEDREILNSIKYHTTGREEMSLLEKIIYLADLVEEGREFPMADELRKLAFNGELDKALLTSFNNTVRFVIDNNQLIHPRTINARNFIMQEMS